MEVKKIKVVKDWPKPKSVCNIQVFLGFAHFYWQFIQGFSRIVALFISILTTTELPNKLAPSKNYGSKWTFSRNDNSGSIFKKNNGNVKVNKFSLGGDGMEYAKNLRKLKGKKLSKSWKLAKSRRNLSKNENLPNFDIEKTRPSFLISEAKAAFNHLQLAFIKTLILWHFDLEYHIWIETKASRYTIGRMLSKLTSGTSPNRVVTKIDLSQ